MRLRRWRLVLPVFALMISLFALTSVTPALAWCDTSGLGRGNSNGYFDDGMYRGGVGTVGGVYGNITNYDPYVYTGTSAIWIMLTDNSNYGQIGYLTSAGSPGPQQGFVQVSEPGTFDFYKYSMTNYQPISYSAYYGNTPGKFTFYQNGGQIRNDPANFTPTIGETAGENLNSGDQMYGGIGFKVKLSNMHIYYSGGWHSFSGTQYNSESYYGNTLVDGLEDDIWDNSCVG